MIRLNQNEKNIYWPNKQLIQVVLIASACDHDHCLSLDFRLVTEADLRTLAVHANELV